jgi:hypothetical protein
LVIGLLAANFALFDWRNPDGFLYFLGEYARYACAYGGSAAIIFGAMLINEFFVLGNLINDILALRASIARLEWQTCVDFEKLCSMEPKLTQPEFFVETEEELENVPQW